jgi:hypothetical protein
LPPAALALSSRNPRQRASADFAPAIEEIETLMVEKLTVTDRDLDELGRGRARAIQDALLGAGTLDAQRIFILGASAQAAPDAKRVRLELTLK